MQNNRTESTRANSIVASGYSGAPPNRDSNPIMPLHFIVVYRNLLSGITYYKTCLRRKQDKTFRDGMFKDKRRGGWENRSRGIYKEKKNCVQGLRAQA